MPLLLCREVPVSVETAGVPRTHKQPPGSVRSGSSGSTGSNAAAGWNNGCGGRQSSKGTGPHRSPITAEAANGPATGSSPSNKMSGIFNPPRTAACSCPACSGSSGDSGKDNPKGTLLSSSCQSDCSRAMERPVSFAREVTAAFKIGFSTLGFSTSLAFFCSVTEVGRAVPWCADLSHCRGTFFRLALLEPAVFPAFEAGPTACAPRGSSACFADRAVSAFLRWDFLEVVSSELGATVSCAPTRADGCFAGACASAS